MLRAGSLFPVMFCLAVVSFVPACFAGDYPATPVQPPADHPAFRLAGDAPFVILQQGDTAWVQPFANSSRCPGDFPNLGHGGEATGGPDGSETWCFELGPGDTCGTEAPWNVRCFDHADVRSEPSPAGVNYWHMDTYRTGDETYTGTYCLWCGADSLWEGEPLECGMWENAPGYGDGWDCIVQLDLGGDFSTSLGCTLWFDPRYDTECKFDYFYVDVWDGDSWLTLAMFNASSDNYSPMGCGPTPDPNPDYFGNTDTGQPYSADWQPRSIPGHPAFYRVISPDTLNVASGPSFRWRFVSDMAWSDADGDGDTDGAAFIDNVWVWCDLGHAYEEDFEHGSWDTLLSRGWSKPDPDPVLQAWHITQDPDAPYEGDDGHDRPGCVLDSSMVWRARPEQGYPGGEAWRNGWFYRLKTPAVPVVNSGCVVQYDEYFCSKDMTCDYSRVSVRFYDTAYGKWCPWVDALGCMRFGGCFSLYDRHFDLSRFYTANAESLQFSWDLFDISKPGDFCRGRHADTDFQIDNVSIGFYDANATQFAVRPIDLFHDTFHDSVSAHNSFFEEYNPDTVATYAGPPYTPVRWNKSLVVYIYDMDEISEARLYSTTDNGLTWVWSSMTLKIVDDPDHPDYGGDYSGWLSSTDHGLARWEAGTEVRYYIKCIDELANEEYFPATANPANPAHTGMREDYLTFSILPMYPAGYTGTRILLVAGNQGNVYDWNECLWDLSNKIPICKLYDQVLADAGYCCDRFDILGVGSAAHVHPIEYDAYDCVIWYTGPGNDRYLINGKAQQAIKDYLGGGGKIILCGDRLAYNMAPVGDGGMGADSLGGDFLSGIMGCEYLEEMEHWFDQPFIYEQALPSVTVFGEPTGLSWNYMDSLVIYRECPQLKNMSYVRTESSPPAGYTAQPLLDLLNESASASPALDGMYVEYLNAGQSVFLNFDLSAVVNRGLRYCDGNSEAPAPDFQPGDYGGRYEIMRTILEDILKLPPDPGGSGGTVGVKPGSIYRWALEQNAPNPFLSGTTIRFEVARAADVSIRVYNSMGQLVRVLGDRRLEPGRHSVRWDGTNASGERVSSGVYFYRMATPDFVSMRKMIVLR